MMRWMWRNFVVIMLLLVSVSGIMAQDADVGAGDFARGLSPDGKTIILMSNREGDERIYAMDADGSNLRELADLWPILDVQFSPDSTMATVLIAFASGSDSDLYLFNRTENTFVPFFAGPDYVLNSAWSPDSRHLLIANRHFPDANNRDRGKDDLWLADVTTGDALNLTHTRISLPRGQWSPDGQHFLVYGLNSDGTQQQEVLLYQADGTFVTDALLAGLACCPGNFLWFPDSTNIAYTLTIDNVTTIYEVSIEYGEVTPLVETGGSVYEVGLSTDGTRLWYGLYAPENTTGDNATGYHIVRLADGTRYNPKSSIVGNVYMAPDGQHLAVLENPFDETIGGHLQIITMPAGSVVSADLTFTNFNVPFWSPDSRSLVLSLCSDGDFDVYRIDAVTGKSTKLTSDDAFTVVPDDTSCLPKG